MLSNVFKLRMYELCSYTIKLLHTLCIYTVLVTDAFYLGYFLAFGKQSRLYSLWQTQ